MDKRQNQRYAIDLDALVHPSEGRSWMCSIRDFCAGGLLLVEPDSARAANSPPVNPGEMVGIHFSMPTKTKARHFRVAGKIVRIVDGGIGISFVNGIDDSIMTALLTHAKKARDAESSVSAGSMAADPKASSAADAVSQSPLQRSQGSIKPSDKKKIIAALRREVAKVLPEMNSAFFAYMDEELMNLVRDSKTNAQQSDYFDAMSKLEQAKKRVSQSFIKEVLDQVDNPRTLKSLLEERLAAETKRKEKWATRKKLSLINTEEFEDWLAVANIISRSERAYDKYLTQLRVQLGMLVDSWVHAEANPLGTSVFCHSFDIAIRGVDLSKEIRQKMYSGFEAKAIPLFRKLYISVIRVLDGSKLFPEYDDDYIVPSPVIVRGVRQTPQGAGYVPAAKTGVRQSAGADAGNEFDVREELESLRDEVRGNRGSSGRAGYSGSGGGGGQGGPSNVRQAISSIHNLITRGGAEEEVEDGGEDVFLSQHEVQRLLTAVRQDTSRIEGERQNVRQMLQGSARANNRRLSPAVMENIQIVENLVDIVEKDGLVSDRAKDWIRQLELTLEKVANQHENFLSDETPHQSLEVINQLARLSGSESGSLRRNINDIVDDINQQYDADPLVFDRALDQLKPVVDRQSRLFTGNIQRTVKASEGQQILVNAQQAVADEMNSRLSGRDIPEVLIRLLVPGWRNLLVNTHLRQGQESNDWNDYTEVIEQLFHHLRGTAYPTEKGYIGPEDLLKQIEYGLDSISFEPGQRLPLVNSLRELMVGGVDRAQIPMIHLAADQFSETLGFGDIFARDKRRQELRNTHEKNREWQNCLVRAKNLHIGDWLEFHSDEKAYGICIVAWTCEDKSNFVFVNRQGVKTHDLMVEELAALLADGSASVLEESDLPLSDRTSHQMLQNMHNQLTHQATHDELTGLVNRKEFERSLDKLLMNTQRYDSNHVVAYLDLDQFKVINNAAGHEVGDQLLINISRILVNELQGNKCVIARLGGDEFGIVIEDCEKDPGISIIKQLSDAIKANRFRWDGNTFALTVSCGVVVVNQELETVSAILTSADSACYAAKDAGRDRIHVFEIDDSEMGHRRDVMGFVSQIDSALREDRFVLNCQKILPISADSDERAHYEILLAVLDEKGEPMPPQDFIVAAETYNKMGAIDRWVIKNSFEWISHNILKLEDLGAFSINISGNSLTEDDFMEFVLDQFNETQLPTSKICFEITETSAIGSLDSAIEFIEKLKVIGVQFSLDDFGTGLSSYSYLRNLPVDFLKIDGIFVKDIKTNPNDYAVVKSINEIGHFMGKKTIAEYVENNEILEILREIGVDFAQGFGIEKKMPITQLL
ncbi:MAG: DUF1631 family protein [bacterium]